MIQWKRTLGLASCMLATTASILGQQSRPAITGISHMSVFTSDPAASEHFYTFSLGASKGSDPQSPNGTRFYFSPTQFVEVLPLPTQHGLSRMARISYSTANAAILREYLLSHGVKEVAPLQAGSDGSHWFETKDPEGNEVEFIQIGQLPKLQPTKPIGTRIIHVGYLVHSKDAEDRFYKDVLGFRPYWYGSMQPGHLDWVSQQVPDGHDWIEYMLVGEGSDVPLAKVDKHEMDVLNHFSIGVPNMEQAVTTLFREDRFLSPQHDGPQMGKDGKWQANLYDPDGTRVELMEFQPVAKPCCSDFTASSPKN
ncbi:VOC family protein [Granulicella sp. S190]|uniref:VOC family protein n=1 Tax=Granulicella sp. S190 TaxID=1747226 RepID=UPI00131AC4D1|nr:VOC family protein [Granulicella sp. S190]